MNRLWLLIASIILLVLGTRFFLFYSHQPQYRDGERVEFETILLSEPKIVSRYQIVSADLPSGEKVFITAPRFPEFSYAQKIYIFGSLKKKLLDNEKTILTMSFPKIEAIKNDQNYGLAITSFIRQKIVSLFQKTLPPAASSLLLGIVFGIKAQMPADLKENFRAVGVLHVIAASGMNVTLVGGFLSALFSVFLRRQLALLFSIIGIIFYAALAGFEPSIIRASIMGILAFCAQIIGRQYMGVFALFVAAFVMLFMSPNILFDVGFQLSFAATLGLILIPKIRAVRVLQSRIPVIGEDIITTVAAQVATLPILLTTFGTYSLWSIVVNGLVLWTIPLLMAIGGIAAVFGFLNESMGQLFLYLCLPLLYYFEWIVSFFAGISGMVNIISVPWQFSVAYYAFLVAAVVYYSSGKKQQL